MGGQSAKYQGKVAGIISEKQALGKLKAEAHFDSSPKGKRYNLQMMIETWLKKIDPLEAAAIFSTTYIIKNGIDWGQTVVEQSFLIPYYNWLLKLFGVDYDIAQAIEKAEGDPKVEITEWILSFGAAYLVVKNFGDIVRGLGNLGSGILSIVSSLFGFKVKAS